jgi:hypothetical protein
MVVEWRNVPEARIVPLSTIETNADMALYFYFGIWILPWLNRIFVDGRKHRASKFACETFFFESKLSQYLHT